MLPSLLLGLLFPSLALARSSASSNLDKFRALAKKNNGVVPLNSALYDELTDGPRDYSVSVLLTAISPQYNCAPCQVFAPEHALVAKQWVGQKGAEEHFFAVLDFSDGQAIFQRLGLTSAPTFQLFKPTTGPRMSTKVGFESFDFGKSGFKAESLAAYLQHNAEIPLKFSRPVDKMKLLLTGAMLGGSIVGGVAFWPMLKKGLSSTFIWSFLTMLIILLMTSGYMWNQIRHPQYVQQAGNGRVNYIAAGYSNQLGAETHLISVVYGILAFSAYTLAYIVPKLRDPIRQRLGVYVWTGISVLMLGVLMNIFTIKQGGYPFRFF